MWRAMRSQSQSACRRYFTTLRRQDVVRLLREQSVTVSDAAGATAPHYRLRIDRELKQAALDVTTRPSDTRTILLSYGDDGLPEEAAQAVATHSIQVTSAVDGLWKAFKKLEATDVTFGVAQEGVVVDTFRVDTDAASRQPWRDFAQADERTELELRAKELGLIFTELDGDIGCVVNGAGLAMATNDVLAKFGGGAANFLDTGGQATTELLVSAFELILSNPKVRAILVNIYGGLIRCDMIAESVVAAANRLDMKGTPVVVRLRGTNMEAGQKIIDESGLSLTSCENIDDAATTVIAQARARKSTGASSSSSVPSGRRGMHTSRTLRMTQERRDAIARLDLTRDTRVIYQGFTGKQATINARATIDYGTNIVGGVSPGKGGRTHLELPVFDTCRKAVDGVDPDASAVFVPAMLAAAAIIEAIEAEIPLVVSVAENIPVHDMLRVHEALRMANGRTRLIGPNCPGTIVPEQCRIGIMPYLQYKPGCVGIVSKSGTLSYEAVGETSRIGLGQSLVVGMGGDMLAGTSLLDALRIFVDRADTRGIVLLGEIGGLAETEAARFLKEYNRSAENPKPVVALVAGWTAPEARVMGHAGALRMPGDMTAQQKSNMLADAGCHVVDHMGQVGATMKRLIAEYDARIASNAPATSTAITGGPIVRGLILGAPGAGKGTQSKRITEKYAGVSIISSGDLLRDHMRRGTALGLQAKAAVSRGELIDDDVMRSLVLEHLRELGLLEGRSFLLDGFPRTAQQAHRLDAYLKEAGAPLNFVVDLDVPYGVILDRIVNRWIHAPSGRTYNLTYNPPKRAGTDDVTGEPLTKRADDDEATFSNRLKLYDSVTLPLKDYYRQKGVLRSFAGETSDIIWPQLDAALGGVLKG